MFNPVIDRHIAVFDIYLLLLTVITTRIFSIKNIQSSNIKL